YRVAVSPFRAAVPFQAALRRSGRPFAVPGANRRERLRPAGGGTSRSGQPRASATIRRANGGPAAASRAEPLVVQSITVTTWNFLFCD
ncbi:hypothetical protein, partial [Streptomyces levis]|uniref:hypothetical protein n=1 Tax=Streptomyces levis TaxID=285566 RepID=UPI0031D2B59D